MVSAVVIRLDDIGAMLRQNRCEAIERAGIIGKVNAQPHQTSIFDEAALDDA